MADPSSEYAKNMTKSSYDMSPEQKKRDKKARVKRHKFNQPKPKKSGVTHGSYAQGRKRKSRYQKMLDEAGKI